MNQSIAKPTCHHGDENQTNEPMITIPLGRPSCYGAVSIFCHDSNICPSCQYFNECDDECLITLEKIKGVVDVSDLFERHETGRKAKGQSVRLPAALATPAIAQTELPAVTDYDLELAALLAETEAQKESLAIQKRDVPTGTGTVIPTSAADLGDVDLMHEAKNIIAKVMDSSKSISVDAVRTASELIETNEPIDSFDSLEPIEPTNPDPLLRLKDLVTELSVHKNYSLIQHEFVGLSITLNNQRLLAPAFRPQPKLGLVIGSPIYMAIHQDQLFIDCHWLHCRREHVVTRDEELQPLFDLDTTFPADLAREFAEQVWTKKHRIEQLLVLTHRQQCQLATLRGKNVENRFEAALTGFGIGKSRVYPKITSVRLKLYEWAERNKGVRKLLKEYEQLWLARELLGDTAPIRQVAELFALISGKPKLNEKTVKVKLETLNKHIGGTK